MMGQHFGMSDYDEDFGDFRQNTEESRESLNGAYRA